MIFKSILAASLILFSSAALATDFKNCSNDPKAFLTQKLGTEGYTPIAIWQEDNKNLHMILGNKETQHVIEVIGIEGSHKICVVSEGRYMILTEKGFAFIQTDKSPKIPGSELLPSPKQNPSEKGDNPTDNQE